MSKNSYITCRFNCICNNNKCDYKHFIPRFEIRDALFKSLDTIPNLNNYNTEEFMTIKKTCVYGQICDIPDCKYKHGYNIDGRELIYQKLEEIKSNYWNKKENNNDKKKTQTSVCAENCLCVNNNCKLFHLINIINRKKLADTIKYIPDLKDYETEDQLEIRKKMCIYGQVCKNKDCTFKHGYNFEGRELIIKFQKEEKEFQKS